MVYSYYISPACFQSLGISLALLILWVTLFWGGTYLWKFASCLLRIVYVTK